MPSPTRIVTAKPPRLRKPAKQTATILVPRIVKNKPANEIERERRWRELGELLKDGRSTNQPVRTKKPAAKPDIQAAMAAEIAKVETERTK